MLATLGLPAVEAVNREQHVTRELKDYCATRRFRAATPCQTYLAELSVSAQLPRSRYNSCLVRQLVDATADICSWIDGGFSAAKEQVAGGIRGLVRILQQPPGCALLQAVVLMVKRLAGPVRSAVRGELVEQREALFPGTRLR
ncbi:terpene synthase family protein [Streptomyces sp. NPDC056486]|uniref:terpene synthase family protein n=1 Tax=Streptomyces sp. NPDC056486 TaxID=3345835 RepID=UPI0036B9B107